MAKYPDAILWIAVNDDTCFLDDFDRKNYTQADLNDVTDIASVSCVLVASIFNKDLKTVILDLARELERQAKIDLI